MSIAKNKKRAPKKTRAIKRKPAARVAAKRRVAKKTRAKKVVKPPEGLEYSVKLTKRGLPKSLSGWIRSAVADAQRLEKTKGYVLNMGTYNDLDTLDAAWNSPAEMKNTLPVKKFGKFKQCELCLGGAAIVGRGLVVPGEGVNGGETTKIAFAMDNVRVGNISSAVAGLYRQDSSRGEPDLTETLRLRLRDIGEPLNYEQGKSMEDRASWRSYLKAAKQLEALGL